MTAPSTSTRVYAIIICLHSLCASTQINNFDGVARAHYIICIVIAPIALLASVAKAPQPCLAVLVETPHSRPALIQVDFTEQEAVVLARFDQRYVLPSSKPTRVGAQIGSCTHIQQPP